MDGVRVGEADVSAGDEADATGDADGQASLGDFG
jgi:hypothetical protein